MKYLVANWKSNKTLGETLEWLEVFKGFSGWGVEAVVCPPFPYLEAMARKIEELRSPLKLGVQDVSPFPYGAYTGEVAGEMVKAWVKYAIVGHSERRRYFHETHQQVANKTEQCLANGLTPIVCVDEPYAQQQIAAIKDELLSSCIFAYEPLAAIGTGTPDKPENAQRVIRKIRKRLPAKVPVIYGGSVTSVNISDYVNAEVSDGALVGGASLKAEEWKVMIGEIS